MNLLQYKTNCWRMMCKFCFFVFNIKHRFLNDKVFIQQGFILANHRSFTDFAIDPYASYSAIVGRHLAFISMLFYALLGFIENLFIIIDRSWSREKIFKMVLDYLEKSTVTKRILFWPEGTRRDYTSLTLEETRKFIKPGLLKSIYLHRKFPVQLMLSNNKENVFNEKKLRCNIGITVNTILSDPIYPEDYTSFETFLEKIHTEWHRIFNQLY